MARSSCQKTDDASALQEKVLAAVANADTTTWALRESLEQIFNPPAAKMSESKQRSKATRPRNKENIETGDTTRKELDGGKVVGTTGAFATKLLALSARRLSTLASCSRASPCHNGTEKQVVSSGGKREVGGVSKGRVLRPGTDKPLLVLGQGKAGRRQECDQVDVLHDCADRALAVVFQLPEKSETRTSDLARLACRLAVDLVELSRPSKALRMLDYVHSRLWPQSSTKASRASDENGAAVKKSRAVQARTCSTVGQPDNKELHQFEAKLTALPPPMETATTSRMHAELMFMQAGLRIWLAQAHCDNCIPIETLVMQKGGIYDRCALLKRIDVVSGSQFFESVFRTLYKISLEKRDDAYQVLEVRLVAMRFFAETTMCTSASFAEQAFKFALVFDRAISSTDYARKHNALLSYYATIMELAQALVRRGCPPDATMYRWCDHCLTVARKCDKKDLVNAVLQYRRDASGPVAAVDVPEDISAMTMSKILSIEQVAAKLQVRGFESLPEAGFPEALSCLPSFLAQMFSESGSSKDLFENLCKSFTRICGFLWKATETMALTDCPTSASAYYEEWRCILRSTSKTFDTLFGLRVVGANLDYNVEHLNQLLPAMIALRNTLGRLESMLDPQDEVTYVKILREVATACEKFALRDEMKATSNTLFFLGGLHYTKKRWRRAQHDFAWACDLLTRFVNWPGAEPPIGRNQDMLFKADVLQLCKRYEYLATAESLSGNPEAALDAVSRALLLLSSCPAPFVIVDNVLSPEICTLIDKHVKYQLSSSLKAYTPVMAALEPRGDILSGFCSMVSWYELHVLDAVSDRRKSESARFKLTDWMLQKFDENQNPVQRSRALLEQARLLRCMQSDFNPEIRGAETIIGRCKEAIQILQNSIRERAFGHDHPLASQSENDLATAYSIMGIALCEADQIESKPFAQALKLWLGLLKKVPIYTSTLKITIKQPKAKAYFHDMKSTYGNIRNLANHFGVLRQFSNRLISLRLLLRLTTLLADSIEFRQLSSSLYADIGLTHIALGYTGQAGLALAQGNALVKGQQCTPETSLYYQLCYSYYLCYMGNLVKSDDNFQTIPPAVNPTSSSLQPSFVCVPQLAAFTSYVHSHLSHRKGKLVDAIAEAEQSLKCLKRACRKGAKSARQVFGITAAMENMSLCSKERKHNVTLGTYDELRQLSHWPCIELLMAVYLWLSRLYVARGSFFEAEHFSAQGLLLASAVHSEGYRASFMMQASEVEYRLLRLDESKKELSRALDCHAKVASHISAQDAVLSKVHAANQSLRAGELDIALSSFAQAEVLLDQAMSHEVIANLEEYALGSENPQEERINPARTGTAQKKAVGRNPPKKTGQKPPVPSDALAGGTELECYILSDIKVDVLSSMASGFRKSGKLEQAEMRLIEAGQLTPIGLQQLEYSVNSAQLRLDKLLLALRANGLFSIFSESAFTLPWNVPKRRTDSGGNSARSQKAMSALVKTIAGVAKHLADAFHLVLSVGSSHDLEAICRNMAFLNIAQAYLTNGVDETAVDQLALTTIYYLELSKGLTYRREMLASLYEKLVDKDKELDSKAAWPSADREQSVSDDAPRSVENILLDAHVGDLSSQSFTFFADILPMIPADWIVCTICVDLKRDDMLLARIEAGLTPVVVRLPLQRQALRNVDDSGISYAQVMAEQREILEASNNTTKDTTAYTTKAEKRQWWRSRQELDERLETLLAQVESSWLGAFKGLLTPDTIEFSLCMEAFAAFQETIKRIVYEAVAQKSSRSKRPAMFDMDPGLCRMLLRLGPEPEYDDVEDALFYMMDAYQFGGVGIDYDEINLDELVDEIRGAHSEFYRAYAQGQPEAESGTQAKHLILIPDKHLAMFPWESLPVLRETPVSRLPSIFFLRDIMIRHLAESAEATISISRQSVHYVLNPSGDLVKTQQTFLPMTQDRSWTGVVGKAPTEDECADALSSKGLYLYFGHGGGEQFIRGHRIRALRKCAVALLLGCSSGYLKPAGEFDPTGTPINYIMGGCPAVLANLWDVTDGDIDKFSITLFEEWGLTNGHEDDEQPVRSLDEAVMRSRDRCKLKYLTGAAPVVYGVPVYIRK